MGILVIIIFGVLVISLAYYLFTAEVGDFHYYETFLDLKEIQLRHKKILVARDYKGRYLIVMKFGFRTCYMSNPPRESGSFNLHLKLENAYRYETEFEAQEDKEVLLLLFDNRLKKLLEEKKQNKNKNKIKYLK